MKKILFVCYGNVGRSQMAEAFYNHLTKSKDAFSAGTDPKTPKKYPKIPEEIYKIMLEEGIDISSQKVKLINKKFINEARKIFIMCKKELCPNYLINSNKTTYWKITDPYKMNLYDRTKIRDEIKAKVKSII